MLPRRHRDADSSRFPTRFTFFLFSITDSFLLKDTHVRLFVKSRRFDIYKGYIIPPTSFFSFIREIKHLDERLFLSHIKRQTGVYYIKAQKLKRLSGFH